MRFLNICVVLVVIFTCQPCIWAQRTNVTQILSELLTRYDHRIRPQFSGPPVEVNVSVYILEISKVSEANMDLTMSLYFRQSWIDERLSFQGRLGLASIKLDSNSEVKIWKPDTFFPNERSASVHQVLQRNSFTEINPDGRVKHSARLTITFSCPMNLRYFPMDSHVCSLEAESYSTTSSEIVYKFGPDKVGVAPELALRQFRFVGHRARTEALVLNSGSYSRLIIDVVLQRACNNYLVTVYIPCMFMVILSWTPFLIKSSTARVLSGLMVTLTTAVLVNSFQADYDLPPLCYVKAIDVYTGVSLSFTFVALLVNMAAEYLAHAHTDANETDIQAGPKDRAALDVAFNVTAARSKRQTILNQGNFYRIAIAGLPIAFVTFNFLYCIIYCIASDINIDDIVKKH